MGFLRRQDLRPTNTLEGSLVATRQAQDVAKEKFLSLVSKAATAEWRWVATEEQCERLVHELTLMSLKGSELCMTITSTLPQAPLPERICSAVAQHTEVAMRLSALWGAESLAAQFVLGACTLMLPKGVLWERWFLGSGSE
jgi:hypothetical protein